MKKILFWFVVMGAHLLTNASPHSIVLLRGTSCSGKSTIASTLHKTLSRRGKSCCLLEYDTVVEEIQKRTENKSHDEIDHEAAIQVFQQAISLSSQNTVIIDLPYNGCDVHTHLKDIKFFSVLVYASPSELLRRDKLRNKRLSRPLKRQKAARHFILSGFYKLYSTEKSDARQKAVDHVCADDFVLLGGNLVDQEKLGSILMKLFDLDKNKRIEIFTKDLHTLVIHTRKSTDECVQKIITLIDKPIC